MFEKTEIKREKIKVMVRITLSTGELVEGDVFISRHQRLTDLLNDDRAFLPVELTDGSVEVVAKTSVASAKALGEMMPLSDDPYEILRVDPRSDDAEIRQAWMTRLKTSHPDRLASLHLDEEIVHAARKVSQRLNAAYDEIMRARRSERAA
ncbi:MAG: DnaJ domain-containing protein [Pseudomonadota bacterium]